MNGSRTPQGRQFQASPPPAIVASATAAGLAGSTLRSCRICHTLFEHPLLEPAGSPGPGTTADDVAAPATRYCSKACRRIGRRRGL